MASEIALNRRRILQLGVMTGVTFSLPPIFAGAAHAADPKSIDLQLGWLVDYNQTGEILAEKLGYFKEEGLTLAIQPGGSNIDGVALVASGQYAIGQMPSSPSLMLAASQKIPVVAFAVGAQRHPFAFFSLAKNPIRTPQDMVGKKIGIQSTSQVLLSAMLKKHGLKDTDVEVVPIGYDMVPLLTGQVDAISGWVIDVGVLKALGSDFVTMSLWDAGIQLYSDVYYTTKDFLEQKPDVLTGFLRATARGWKYAYDNRDEAVAALIEANSNMVVGETREALDALLKYEFNDKTLANGWGTMDPAVWQAQIDTYNDLGQFSAGPPKIEDVMTMSILDSTKDVRPKLG